jgi:hypothetical protein
VAFSHILCYVSVWPYRLSACIISIKLEITDFLFNTNTHAIANVTDHYNEQQRNMNLSDHRFILQIENNFHICDKLSED